jgi:tRNA pseudouridine55 synthase
MQRKIVRRVLDGVLLLDKPTGMTSNAALQSARRLFNAAKAGHTGTLDPMATGLLPLTFGEATKFSQMLLDADKTYEATIRLGIETDTGDADGAVIASGAVAVGPDVIEAALPRFRGDIEQIPPMYSALKRDGKPLYEYARAGVELERAPRRVVIRSLELLDTAPESLRIRVACSKGTYIRTLAIDLGRALGCGAHLSALRRVQIGPFGLERAVSLGVLEDTPADARDALLAPVDALVSHLPRIDLDREQSVAMLQKRVLDVVGSDADPFNGLVRIYGEGRFLGLGERRSDAKLSPKRLVATSGSRESSRSD